MRKRPFLYYAVCTAFTPIAKPITMRSLTIAAACCFLLQQTNAQLLDNTSLNLYYNNFLKFTDSSPDADSAYYYVRRLSDPRYAVLQKDLLQNWSAQYAQLARQPINSYRNKAAAEKAQRQLQEHRNLIAKLAADDNRNLKEMMAPILSLNKIEDSTTSAEAVKEIINKFIDKELSSDKIYTLKTGRYALLMYQAVAKRSDLQPEATALLSALQSALQKAQPNVRPSSTREDLMKRAWCRFMDAYIHYSQAESAATPAAKEQYLKAAYESGPDLTDQNHQYAVTSDINIFMGKAKNIKEPYLNLLISTGAGQEKILPVLLDMSLVDLKYKEQLKSYYAANNTSGQSFDDYWKNAIAVEIYN